MKTKILNTIKKYNMINKGDTVAVALSGGADSMALFHFLCVNKDELNINVVALHVNHGLRIESDDEEKIVKNYCHKMNVECIVKHENMNNNEKPKGDSTEVWARNLRYNFFNYQAKIYNAKIATAHTLSDKTETLILNITRGTGVKGITSIPAMRDNIIRPLIDCTREEIETYCSDNDIPFVNDATNFQDIYSRNKIRLKVVPVLKQVNPSVEKSVMALSEEMAEVYTLLTQLSDNLYRKSIGVNGFSVNIINSEHPAVIKNFLRNLLEKYNCLSSENVLSLYKALNQESFSRQLSKNVFCGIKSGNLYFYKPKKVDENATATLQTEIKLDENIKFLSNNFIFSVVNAKEIEKIDKNKKNYLTYMADYDKIKNALILRNRKTGDSFNLYSRKVTKTLKKMFIEDKLPQNLRNSLAVLATVEDEVIWIENYGVSGDFTVSKQTKNILLIQLL